MRPCDRRMSRRPGYRVDGAVDRFLVIEGLEEVVEATGEGVLPRHAEMVQALVQVPYAGGGASRLAT